MLSVRLDKLAILVAVVLVAWVAALTWRRWESYFQPATYAEVSLPNESEDRGLVEGVSGLSPGRARELAPQFSSFDDAGRRVKESGHY